MFLLALDCSTASGVLALGRRKSADRLEVVGQTEFAAGRGCGGELFVALEQAMEEIRTVGEPLTGIVVGLGPGSYSGVRQAVAAASGLAAATGAWLSGIPSTAALRQTGDAYQAVGDARRGSFYFTAVDRGRCVAGPELLPDAASLHARLAERPAWPVRIVGTALPEGLLADAAVVTIDAAKLLAISRGEHLLPPLEPIYLRPVSITPPKTAKAVVP